MRKRIKRKIEFLREQPEHVRIRAALRFTVASGVVLGLIWLAVLLPLQVWLQSRGVDTETAAPEVSGVQDSTASPTPTVGITP